MKVRSLVAFAGMAAAISTANASELRLRIAQGDIVQVTSPGCVSTSPRTVGEISALQITRDGWVYFIVPSPIGSDAIVRIEPISNEARVIGTPNVPGAGCPDAERRLLGRETLVARSGDRSAWLQVGESSGPADYRLVRGSSGFISPHPGANSISLSRLGDPVSASSLVSIHFPSAPGAVDRVSSSIVPIGFPAGLCGFVVPVFPDPGASPAVSESDFVVVKAECLGSGLIRFPIELGPTPILRTDLSELIAVSDTPSTLGAPVTGAAGWLFDTVADGPIFYTTMDDGAAVYHSMMKNGFDRKAVVALNYVQPSTPDIAVAYDAQPTFVDTVGGREDSEIESHLSAGDTVLREVDIAVASSTDATLGRVFVKTYQAPSSNAPRALISVEAYPSGTPQPLVHLAQNSIVGCLDNFNLIAAGRSGRALVHTFGDSINSPDGLSAERVRVVDRYSREIVASVGQTVDLGVPGETWTIVALGFYEGLGAEGIPRGPKYLGGNSGGDGRVSLVADDGTVVFRARLQPLTFPSGSPAPSEKWVVFTSNPTPACGFADIADTDGIPGPDGAVDNGDFNVFFNAFFANSLLADIANTDGLPLPDCTVDNGDFGLFFLWFSATPPCQ
jgi:hypothetical protein